MMPDMLPRVGAGKKPHVFYNTGHGHLGWTLSGATADLIGDTRFETRARARFDLCFEGTEQSYHHALHGEHGACILRCDMKPVTGSDGALIGALVYMTDVTEQARRLRPSSDVMSLPLAGRSTS